jgi:HD-GYP domain-containing protein (c-di-GMP phosphodiesterase class II)
MFIDTHTVSLCLGHFIRQELKFALESWNVVRGSDTLESPIQMTSGYPFFVLERVILRLLDTFCDPDTSTHAQRLVSLASATAQYLSLPPQDIIAIRQAALLHDLGKIGIPASILQKPGPLTPDERAIMRLHPGIGQHFILHMSVFAHLAPIIVAHHESWDGSGYPAGLTGTRIPRLARILAIIDSYDAMTSSRPYGRPFSHQEACQEIQRCAGHQYDPALVAAFLRVVEARRRPIPLPTRDEDQGSAWKKKSYPVSVWQLDSPLLAS